MNVLNMMVRGIGRTLLAPLTLACALPLATPAQNLLPNPGFEKPAAGVTPGTTVSHTNFCNGGTSAAAAWLSWVNTCGSDISTTLVPSTAPSGGSYMMHVVTNGANNGIYANFTSMTAAQSSVWVFVSSGCVGIGTGFGPETADTDEMTCVTGQWIRFYKVPNSVSPATELVIYSVQNPLFPAPGGADFYVDNGRVSAAPAGASQASGDSGVN